MQFAGLLGSLLAPLLYQRISGHVLTLAGIFTFVGLMCVSPVLYRAWKQLVAGGGALPQADLERLRTSGGPPTRRSRRAGRSERSAAQPGRARVG